MHDSKVFFELLLNLMFIFQMNARLHWKLNTVFIHDKIESEKSFCFGSNFQLGKQKDKKVFLYDWH